MNPFPVTFPFTMRKIYAFKFKCVFTAIFFNLGFAPMGVLREPSLPDRLEQTSKCMLPSLHVTSDPTRLKIKIEP